MRHPPVILFDIDGTLADIQHRRSFLESEKPDWKSFNAAMGNDALNHAVAELYKILWNSGNYEVILVTGRTDDFRELTKKWLQAHNIPFKTLLMRSKNDYRADHIIKEEILQALLNKGKVIAFAVDDRQQVVDMWRRNGITCFQCAEGNF